MPASPAEEGGWGPPPPWWLVEQERKKQEERERKKKKEEEYRRQEAEGGSSADPKRSAQLALEAGPAASKGSTDAPIPVEETDGSECFKCGRVGHYQNMCHFKPLCVMCHEEGHALVHCPTRGRPLMLQIMGNTIPGEGFFCLPFVETEGEEVRARLVADAAVILAAPGMLSFPILEVELPHLFDGEWDWQVTAVGDNMFLVVFPNKAMLRMATRSGKLFLSLNNIMAEIKESLPEEPKPEIMPDVWVKLWGVPPKHRRVDRLMAGTVMIGHPMEVDKASLVGLGPVRMRFACRSPAKLCGYVQLWFNSEGYTIRLEAEADGLQGAAPPPPASLDKGPDGKDKDRDTSMGDDSIDTASWDKLGIKDKDSAAMAPAGGLRRTRKSVKL
nr:uncharacterized protein LOC109731768 [Aegilops tauschii subsp. strangulata]